MERSLLCRASEPRFAASNESRRETECRTPFAFGTSHFTSITLVIKAGNMQGAVQHQDADLVETGVANLLCLRLCAFERDGNFVQAFESRTGREGENIRREVVIEKRKVEPPQFVIVCDQA